MNKNPLDFGFAKNCRMPTTFGFEFKLQHIPSMHWLTCFGIRLSDIASINKSFVRAHYQSQLTESLRRAVLILLELLFAKLGYFSISCLSLMRILLMLLILFVPLDACCLFYVCISYILYFVHYLLCISYTDNNQVRASLPPDKPQCFTMIQWNSEISEGINHLVDVNEAYTATRSTVHNSREQLLPQTADYNGQNTRMKFGEHGFSDSGLAAWNGLRRHLRAISDTDGERLGRRHDGSLVTDDEDEFGGVSRDQSEKYKCGDTWCQ